MALILEYSRSIRRLACYKDQGNIEKTHDQNKEKKKERTKTPAKAFNIKAGGFVSV